jgi:hypothetical protein
MSKQDYQSPLDFLEAVQDRFGQITFDLSCTRENSVAPMGYFHPEHDALKCEIPPTVLLLVPASVDANWFRDYVHERALVLPLSPRLTFIDQPAPINRPLMLCVYGPNITPGFEPWQWKQPKNKKENK